MAAQQILLLISKTVSGDNKAFEQLILSQKHTIFYMIRSMIDHSEDIEDISQEVAILIYKYIGSLKCPEAFWSWLDTLVSRVCLRHYAAHDPADPFDSIPDHENLFVETDSDCLPAAHTDLLELRSEIQEALVRMPENLREVATMRYIYGMRYREIADMLGIAIGTVSTYLFRARERLRSELDQYIR